MKKLNRLSFILSIFILGFFNSVKAQRFDKVFIRTNYLYQFSDVSEYRSSSTHYETNTPPHEFGAGSGFSFESGMLNEFDGGNGSWGPIVQYTKFSLNHKEYFRIENDIFDKNNPTKFSYFGIGAEFNYGDSDKALFSTSLTLGYGSTNKDNLPTQFDSDFSGNIQISEFKSLNGLAAIWKILGVDIVLSKNLHLEADMLFHLWDIDYTMLGFSAGLRYDMYLNKKD